MHELSLEFGSTDELRAKYGANANLAPLPDSSITHPSLIVKTGVNAKPTGDRTGCIINLKEV